MDFYEYLSRQFKDITGAKTFYNSWVANDQDISDHPEWSGTNCYSMRAMAGHISSVLTGEEYNGTYMETKYGSEIYLNA